MARSIQQGRTSGTAGGHVVAARHGAGVVDDRIQIILGASILVACMSLNGD